MGLGPQITSTIRGSATRPPKSAGRVPFSVVKLSDAAQKSHIFLQEIANEFERCKNVGFLDTVCSATMTPTIEIEHGD